MPTITIKGLEKSFGIVRAVDRLDLLVEDAKIYTLLGPSGCGKSTTLRCLAGLEKPDSGHIAVGDRVVTDVQRNVFVPPAKRKLGMVFQSYAVWPHMSVFDNVAYPLRVRRASQTEIRDRVKNSLALVRLEGLEKRHPSELSGGQQQRVALARALVYEPEVLLLDEPLSNLDAKLRESMRFELKQLQRRLNITSVYVTHDQEESLVISDTVCVMNVGKIMQSGTPKEIYESPANRFVADFIGKTNLIESEVQSVEGSQGEYKLYTIRTTSGLDVNVSSVTSLKQGEKVVLSVRPEDIELSKDRPREKQNTFTGEVKEATFLGDRIDFRLAMDGQSIRAILPPNVRCTAGDSIFIHLRPENCTPIREPLTA